ncbi:hypothetical protein IFM89_000463 [Coptis chinensis]|uniref:Uncharacterized protein n=1 Tax=Coptis chinensis TaxID=261450 RepID=A0A835LCY2_9MAGN|nr:hypothetical protein IFM89_000463 [Coptis chinensis]
MKFNTQDRVCDHNGYAPKTIKTAASISCLRVNADLVKTESLKPKDVWAVQLAIGTYQIDGKHFRPWTLINNEYIYIMILKR